VPWRFRNLFKGLKREPKTSSPEDDNTDSKEDPLVRETRRLAAVTHRLVVWTRVIAGIGILAFFASLLQWDAMRGQLGEMRAASDDTKKAISATNRLSDAARVSNDLGQRGNISLKDIVIYRGPTGIAIIPQWENIRNIVSKIISRINYEFSRDPLPVGFSWVDNIADDTPISLRPKEISDIWFITLPQECIDNATKIDRFRQVNIWGWAKYTESFTGEPRTTRFCWNILGIRWADSDKESARFLHALCREGNCADKDCPDEPAIKPTLPPDVCVPVTIQAPQISADKPKPQPPGHVGGKQKER
jgi:hypothetical protein